MELEKTLFRIHERVLSQESALAIARICKFSFAVSGIILLSIFLYANSNHRRTTGCLGPVIDQFRNEELGGKSISNDTVVFVNVCAYNKTLQTKAMSFFNYTYFDHSEDNYDQQGNLDPNKNDSTRTQSNTINPSDGEQISPLPSFINPKKKQLRSLCIENPKIQIESTAVLQSLTYPKEMRVVRNITTIIAYIEPSCYSSNMILDKLIFGAIGIEPIIINELIENFKLFLSLFRINLGLFYISAVSALYIKISIICSPVFILVIMYCMRCLGNHDVSITTLSQTFPYLGIYLSALRGTSSTELVKSFLKMMLMVYFVYLSALVVGSYMLFQKQIPKGLDENFLTFVAMLELFIMLFVRTRSSIKWLPRATVLIMGIFLFYVQNTIYGYYTLLLLAMVSFVLSCFFLILEEFEIPSVSWNESYHYTPSVNRPRCLYFPIFNLSWFHDLPQLWTMFYPLYGRDHFSSTQLSLVDSDYLLLNQTLENAESGQNHDDHGINLLNNPQRSPRAQIQGSLQNPSGDQDIEMQQNQQEQVQQIENHQFPPSNILGNGEGPHEPLIDSNDNSTQLQNTNLLPIGGSSIPFFSGRGVQIGVAGENINHYSETSDYQKLS